MKQITLMSCLSLSIVLTIREVLSAIISLIFTKKINDFDMTRKKIINVLVKTSYNAVISHSKIMFLKKVMHSLLVRIHADIR